MTKKTFDERFDCRIKDWKRPKNNCHIKDCEVCEKDIKDFVIEEVLQVLERVKLKEKEITKMDCWSNDDVRGLEELNRMEENYNQAVQDLDKIINDLKKEYEM
ncbi:hypothetical protein MYX07_00270 [Patescibacteria group bacterium AH-259-L07]|nr:hypothetical protein [Patescibacteria group bacterium AH-259-L07]